MHGDTNVGQPDEDGANPNDQTFDNYLMNPNNPGAQIGGVGRNIP